MADPFSIVAGVAGVASTGAGLACSLFRIAEGLKSAGDEINLFAVQVGSLSSVMEVAHELLSANSLLLGKITGANDALGGMIIQNRLINSRVRATKRQLRSFREDITIIVRFRWLVEKHRVEQLKQEIGSAMSSMNLLMNSLMLAELLTQRQADSKKIKRLSLQIKSLVKTVEVQKYRNRNQHALHDDVLRNEHDIQKALLDIAKGIVKETEEYFESHPATASSVPVARSGRKRRRLISIAPIAENVESSLSSLPSDNSSSQSRNESSATQLSSTQQSSLSYNLSVGRDEADNSVEHPNADDEEAQPQSIEATNYTSVRPVGYNLDIDNLDTAEAISGYINEQSITVLVVPEFDNNLISLNFAAAQDLHVPPLREGDETNWLDFGNGIKEPIVGVVALRWKQSDRPGSPGFTVWCSVCRHNFRGVVFGRPFIQKRLGYSNSQL